MHIRLLAVGDRQPSWVDEAFGVYSGRLPREWKFRLDVIPTVRRNKNDKSRQAMEAEGDLILGKLGQSEQVVLLDERGKQLSSKCWPASSATGRSTVGIFVLLLVVPMESPAPVNSGPISRGRCRS